MVKKYNDILSRFDNLLECDRRTDEHNYYFSIVHQNCFADTINLTSFIKLNSRKISETVPEPAEYYVSNCR